MKTKIENVQDMTLEAIGSHFATYSDTFAGLGAELVSRYPNGLTDEAEDALLVGIDARKVSLYDVKSYLIEGSVYTEIIQGTKLPVDAVTCEITIPYALSFSKYEIGKLEPVELKKLVQVVRKIAQDYRNKVMATIKSSMAGEKPKVPRSANKAWVAACDDGVIALWKRSKVAKSNEDPTAPANRVEFKKMVNMAIDRLPIGK